MDPVPSLLLAILPDPAPPVAEVVAARVPGLEPSGAALPQGPRDALWLRTFVASEGNGPLALWAAGIEHLPPAAEFDPQPLGPGVREALRAARWMLGTLEVLDPDRPREAWQAQLRRLLAAAPDALCLYDASSYRLWPMAKARAVAAASTPPSATCLYFTHVVLPGEADAAGWVHTHGLQRAGFPDVEVLGIPGDLGTVAGTLIENFVGAFLGTPLPPARQPFDMFLDHDIAWLAWREAARHMPGLGESGDPVLREQTDHGGFRIVLVDPRPAGVRAPLYHPPLEILEAMRFGDPVILLNSEETARRRAMALERWPALVDLFRLHRRSPGWDFLVQLAFDRDTPCSDCGTPGDEHLWFEILEVELERVRGRLLSRPLGVARLKPGRAAWHPLARIVDWRVESPGRLICPDTVALA